MSPREREVALLICRGFTNKEIADHLIISKRTVEDHVASLRRRLGARHRVDVLRHTVVAIGLGGA